MHTLTNPHPRIRMNELASARGDRFGRVRAVAGLAGVLVATVLCVACETKVDSSAPRGNAAQNPPKSESTTVIPGGGSALGKAKNSAESIQDKVDEHNKNIEKAIDDTTNPK